MIDQDREPMLRGSQSRFMHQRPTKVQIRRNYGIDLEQAHQGRMQKHCEDLCLNAVEKNFNFRKRYSQRG